MRILLYIFLAVSFSYSQPPSKFALSGANMYINQRITFGGNNYLSLATGVDTLSDPVVVEVSTVRPSQMFAIEYIAISDDSTSSAYRFDLESRICTTPATSVGCPTYWVTPRWRRIYNTGRMSDTVTVSVLPEDSISASHVTMLPTGNQIRLRVRSEGTATNYFRELFIRGF